MDNSESPPSLDLLFKNGPATFETLVTLKNVTTDAAEVDGSMISLLEFQEQGFALEVPSRSCASGHHLAIKILLRKPDEEEFHFDATVKVERTVDLPAKKKRIEVTLMQYSSAAWERLQEMFSSRQNEIVDFFEAATGRR